MATLNWSLSQAEPISMDPSSTSRLSVQSLVKEARSRLNADADRHLSARLLALGAQGEGEDGLLADRNKLQGDCCVANGVIRTDVAVADLELDRSLIEVHAGERELAFIKRWVAVVILSFCLRLSCTRLRVPPVALHVSQLISWIL